MDQILDEVYLGDIEDAEDFPGCKLTVHEGYRPNELPGKVHWVPIIQRVPYMHANKRMLDAAAEIIQYHHEQDKRILVHCKMGIERGPLTVAYWLDKFHHEDTINSAYNHVQAQRQQTQIRTHWLDQP